MRGLDDITDLMDMNLSKFWETVQARGAWYAAVRGVSKSWAQFSSLTTIQIIVIIYFPVNLKLIRCCKSTILHYKIKKKKKKKKLEACINAYHMPDTTLGIKAGAVKKAVKVVAPMNHRTPRERKQTGSNEGC